MKQVFFIDLDNTIYFTKPNEDVLMKGLYDLLEQQDLKLTDEQFMAAKAEMLRTPFLKVAEKYEFPKEVTDRLINYLSNREVTQALIPSDDYHYIKSLKGRKFIVTAGFPKQQYSKVKMLGIADDFEDVQVVDVAASNKKQAFLNLIEKFKLNNEDILIIGDDAESEIKYGLELGIETFLLDPENLHPNAKSTYIGKNLSQLHQAAGQ
ncbi:HAD hydrolase-like protein [Pedobacter sp. MC2016-05]|uniref:HAD family hydrolase n=1 Tax=Pedobacter sp. MC2016-05 TaxID=2994474 RepID=UPI00224633E8|nr:HAD family hydrolase [Pedobacter sp. MC2016-05]MCX2475275.1 HAD hydrolase-like protein [Pedobacter sp. MC2016-05]